MNEINLSHVAQQLAILGICAGFVGAALWALLTGTLGVLAERLHARAARRQRIAAARNRVFGDV
ncbi:hypothetical protein LJR129_001128 [Acidovorax sp. LjRoot129]|uniref:hypothetical protein n=1 Tax=Acidovorax sp. LjRoot129 TaxID=3342260 RepID=UPI003ECED4E0